MSEIQEIVEMLDTRITNDYKVVEISDDTIYIRSRKSGNMYTITVSETEA